MEQARELSVNYDRASDVLYVTIDANRPCLSREIEEGVLIRYDPDTNELVGVTVTGFKRHHAAEGVKVEAVHGSLKVDPDLALA